MDWKGLGKHTEQQNNMDCGVVSLVGEVSKFVCVIDVVCVRVCVF